MLLNAAKNIFLAASKYGGVSFVNLAGNTYTILGGNNTVMGNCLQGLCGGQYGTYHGAQYGTCYIEVGFGDTPVSASDYNLADSNETNPKLTCVSSGKGATTIGDINHPWANFRNDGGTNVVVREIGLVSNVAGDQQIAAARGLIFRKVLDNPVTIAPGETYGFSYNVRLKNT